MKNSRYWRALGSALILATLLATTACGGHSSPALAALHDPAPRASAPGPASTEPALPALPALPSGAADLAQPRTISDADNLQNGSQAVQTAELGVFVTDQTKLALGPLGVGKVAWGVWRWGQFTGGFRPLHLTTQLEVAPQNKYWVLLANYGTGRWEIIGPEFLDSKTYDFPASGNYISPTGNTYVALAALGASQLTVASLNLIADNDVTSPGPPTAVSGVNVKQHSARLTWAAPADLDLNHYELYQVTSAAALETDPAAIALSTTIAPADTVYELQALQSETHYYYRMKAVDASGNKSVLSTAGSLVTLSNQPPVPAFTFTPTAVMKNVGITFDPSTSSDPDDAPENLTCYWDWNDDGVDDTVSAGLSSLTHTFHQQGLATVRLTVSDSTERVATKQTLNVQPFTDIKLMGYEVSGEASTALGSASDYATGRIAVVIQGGGWPRLRLFDGSAWSQIDMTQLFSDYIFRAVAFTPAGKTAVLMTLDAHPLQWFVFETGGAGWTQVANDSVDAADTDQDPLTDPEEQGLCGGGSLAYAPNGRISVGLVHSRFPKIGDHPDFLATVYHQLPDNSFEAGPLLWLHPAETGGIDPYFGQYPATPISVSRTDTASQLVYSDTRLDQISTDVLTDGGSTITDFLSFAGLGTFMSCGPTAADPTHVFWALSTKEGKIYYGDNYGAPNGVGQIRSYPYRMVAMLGAQPLGDNQGLFYWTESDDVSGTSDDETYFRGFNSGLNTTYSVDHGVGLSIGGQGGWMHIGGQDGMYSIFNEMRDGQVTAYFLQAGAISELDTITEPLQGSYVGANSLALTMTDGSLTVLAQEASPTALMSVSPDFGKTFVTSQLGVDTWAYPDCAAPDAVPGQLLLGSLYFNYQTAKNDLVLNRFDQASPVGTHVQTIKDVKRAWMAYNVKSTRTQLVYEDLDQTTLTGRYWQPASQTWGAPMVVFAGGAAPLNDVVLRPRPDGEWGAVWNEVDSTVRLAETVNGVWQTPAVISTALLDLPHGSIDLSYSANGDAGLVVERDDGLNGIYFGYKPVNSSAVTWDYTNGTKGFNTDSLQVHWLPESGPILTYNVFSAAEGLGLRLVQRGGTTWTTASLPFFMNGDPIACATGWDNTLAFAGSDNSTGQGTVCLLNW